MAVETHEKTRPDCVFGWKGAVEFGCIYTLLVDKYFQQERELEPAKAKHCSNSTHISQYNRSRATLDATGRHYWYWTSICIVSPQQPPWSRWVWRKKWSGKNMQNGPSTQLNYATSFVERWLPLLVLKSVKWLQRTNFGKIAIAKLQISLYKVAPYEKPPPIAVKLMRMRLSMVFWYLLIS